MYYKDYPVKTMQDWTADESIDEFLEIGDLVDESVFDNFLNLMPPHVYQKSDRLEYLQTGEPYGVAYNPIVEEQRETYLTFEQIRDDVKIYMYLGHCFTGDRWDADVYKPKSIAEFMRQTYRINFYSMEQETRPHIICDDGFEFSIQAGTFWNSVPRNNLRSFEAVEVGYPTSPEELLMDYRECFADNPTDTIYPFVPVELVEKFYKKHSRHSD